MNIVDEAGPIRSYVQNEVFRECLIICPFPGNGFMSFALLWFCQSTNWNENNNEEEEEEGGGEEEEEEEEEEDPD